MTDDKEYEPQLTPNMAGKLLKADELATVYIKIRTAIKDKEEEHKTELAPLQEQMDTISDALLTLCKEQNASTIKTDYGTISRRTTSRYWTSDWERMYDFIKEHDAPYLLEQRIHNTNMKKFLDENPDELPVGLQANTKYAISVRKPPAK